MESVTKSGKGDVCEGNSQIFCKILMVLGHPLNPWMENPPLSSTGGQIIPAFFEGDEHPGNSYIPFKKWLLTRHL